MPEGPPCDPSFCETCYYYCGEPPFDTCGEPLYHTCKVHSICEVCAIVCTLNEEGECPVGCPYVPPDCPSPPPTPAPSDLLELCSTLLLELFTDPGRVTATVPQLSDGTLQSDGSPVTQQPPPGELLEPGETEISLLNEQGEPICVVPTVVTLDPDSGIFPEVEYFSAGEDGEPPIQGQVPSIQIGPLEDELGGPVLAQVYVDEIPIEGFDLNEASDIFAEPGIHVTTVNFTDVYNRTTTYEMSEWFDENVTALNTTGIPPTPAPSPSEIRRLFGGTTLPPNTTITTVATTDPTTTSSPPPNTTTTSKPPPCKCTLVKKETGSEDCEDGENPTGDGEEDYRCDKQILKKLSVSVTDHWGEPDSHATADSGYRTDEFEIVCYTAEAGTVVKVPDCKTCCPDPVILATVSARIGALKVYAEDGTDRAHLAVKLQGSGIGMYSVESEVATGFQSYTIKNGITVGLNAGVGASQEKGPSASGGLTASTSTESTYSGESSGWQTSQPIPKTSITSWHKGECSKEHTLSVSFDTDMLADVDDWEQFFGITSDTSSSSLSKPAYMDYTKVTFRCDGGVPEVGVVGK